MTMHRYGFLLALLLSGCASMAGLAPHGQRTAVQSLAIAKTAAGVKVSAAAWPAADWWRALGDPQLDALVAEALQGNPDMQAVAARVQLAQAGVEARHAALLPSVDAKATANAIRIPETVVPAPFGGSYSTLDLISVGLGYSFDLWGGKRAAWEAALGQQRAAEVDVQAARLALSADVVRTYVRLAGAIDAQNVTQNDLSRARKLLALTQQRLAAGIDSRAQLKQAEAAAASAEQKFAQAQSVVEANRLALAVLLGKGPDRGLEIAAPRPMRPLALAVPESLPAQLLGRRPDIVAARWRVEVAQHEIDTAKADFYPNVNLAAGLGLASLHLDHLVSAQARYGELAPAISLPIFDGGRLRANLAAHDADYDLAVAQYNKTLVAALNEVADQLNELRSLSTQAAAQQRALSSAQEAWELSSQRYRNGVGSYLEVLTVQQALFAAELVQATIETQQLDRSVQLARALGGGFVDSAPASVSASTH